VREIDQHWIYDSYTCQASNAVRTSQFSIELTRAGLFTVTEATDVALYF